MSAIKNFFREELQWRNFMLEHSTPSDFYLSAWQSSRSAVPLLVLRSLLFLTCLGITIVSVTRYTQHGWFEYWWIYVTNWGLMVMSLTTGFAAGVSARCHFYGPIRAEYWLPCYVKAYWVLFNIAVPSAFHITIFYWTVLFEAGVEDELSFEYDVTVHAINSVLMFILMTTSSHPGRLLHVYQPLIFAFVFSLFTLFYYLAGGTNRHGEPYVYPTLNWNKAGTTVVVLVLTHLLLILMYVFTISIIIIRDAVSRRFIKPRGSEPPAPEAMP